MPDLVCLECEWYTSRFHKKKEIRKYISKTELIKTHFTDQDCPKCGAEESTELFYRMCTDCGEAEVDCTCDIETPDMSEEEIKKIREDIRKILKQKENTEEFKEEREKREFKERDLRRMAGRLIEDTWA